jgi:hypothetical protein
MTGGKCPKLYTYPIVSNEFSGAAIIASNICRAVEAKYKQERWQVSVGRKSICNYRSFPWVLLSNKSVKTMQIDSDGEYLTARIKLLGGWWTVRLAGGSNCRYQVKGIRAALKVGRICDSKIWTDRKHRAIIGVSVCLPEPEKRTCVGTLRVNTSRDNLIVATKDQTDTPFVITGDVLRGWIKERDRRYQRLRQDRKSGASRQGLSNALRRIGDKWARRIDSYMHETSAKIVDHAKRRSCSTVIFDGTIKSFGELPWHDLKTKIEYKCEDAGMEFVDATQQVAEPDINNPHVYFKYSPSTHRIKIGRTGRLDGGRHGAETDSPEELTILAVDNQPKNKLVQREKHHHAYFAEHRVKGEWFDAAPVIHWLREAKWFGNAGNLSQIAQVLPVQFIAQDSASSRPECECASGDDPDECSQKRLIGEDICRIPATALAVNELSICH